MSSSDHFVNEELKQKISTNRLNLRDVINRAGGFYSLDPQRPLLSHSPLAFMISIENWLSDLSLCLKDDLLAGPDETEEEVTKQDITLLSYLLCMVEWNVDDLQECTDGIRKVITGTTNNATHTIIGLTMKATRLSGYEVKMFAANLWNLSTSYFADLRDELLAVSETMSDLRRQLFILISLLSPLRRLSANEIENKLQDDERLERKMIVANAGVVFREYAAARLEREGERDRLLESIPHVMSFIVPEDPRQF